MAWSIFSKKFPLQHFWEILLPLSGDRKPTNCQDKLIALIERSNWQKVPPHRKMRCTSLTFLHLATVMNPIYSSTWQLFIYPSFWLYHPCTWIVKLTSTVPALQYCICSINLSVSLKIISEISVELYNLMGLLQTLLQYLFKVKRRMSWSNSLVDYICSFNKYLSHD